MVSASKVFSIGEISRLQRNQALTKLIVCIFVFSTCFVPFAVAADQSAPLPTRTLGDEWKFAVDYKGDEGTLFNLTTTVTATSVVNPSGDKDCFELTSAGSGIVYGTNISGTASFAYKEYYGTNDFNLVEISQNRTVTTTRSGVTNRTSQTTNTVYNPAFGINSGFPLSAGKTWTANCTATGTATTDTDGKISQENSTYEVSMNFVVDRIESITVAAGTFETYVMKGTGVDGSTQEIYYAPAVGMQVKEVDSDPSGNVVATMELTSYHLAGASTTDALSMYWILATALAVAFAILGVGLLAIRQRKTAKRATAQP